MSKRTITVLMTHCHKLLDPVSVYELHNNKMDWDFTGPVYQSGIYVKDIIFRQNTS
jgi:hypothetical protein